jgi:DNA-binding MarR family transcriptional regulator
MPAGRSRSDGDDADPAWRDLIQLFLSQEAEWADLAARMGVTKSYVTALVKQLAIGGHVTVGSSDSERRERRVALIEAG